MPNTRIPDARRDRERNLARLYRDICFLDTRGVCDATNAVFAVRLDVHEATVRRLLSLLEHAGLIVRDYAVGWRGRDRIRPLLPPREAIERGWVAFAEAILEDPRWTGEIRRESRALQNRAWIPPCRRYVSARGGR